MSIPPGLKMLGWRIAWNCLPIADTLIKREIMVNSACCFCNKDESALHFFKNVEIREEKKKT